MYQNKGSLFSTINNLSYYNFNGFPGFRTPFTGNGLLSDNQAGVLPQFAVSTQFRAYPFERALFSALNRVLLKIQFRF